MHRTRLLFLIGVCALLWPSTVARGQSLTSKLERARTKQRRLRIDRTLITLRQLNRVIPEVDFDDEPFEEVLDWFREQGIRNIVVHWRKLEDFGEIDRLTPVTLQMTDMTIGELLDDVLGRASAGASQAGAG